MKKAIPSIITVIIILTLSILSLLFSNIHLSENQLNTFYILLIVCGSSITYCFVVGELANNYSQMDKLWSLLPIAYVWIIAARGGMSVRLIVYAVIVTLWGIRLTFNFARKGAYKLKFWDGEEDYRWAIVKGSKYFKNRFAWAMFDLFFISIYQNVLILAMVLPALAVMDSQASFGVFDFIASISASLFLILEVVADEQQWKFQETKKRQLKEGKKLEELDAPYNLGFNTTGLWGFMRHPNYLGEQAIWLCLYIFTIGAGVTAYGVLNWSIIGPLFIVLLFMGSSMLGEKISSGKYPKYSSYTDQVFKYLPIRKFDPNK